jgi:uncharacterized protein
MTMATLPALSPLETRVLGVLVEKQSTTPDIYPMTVNALLSGCNQKTSRQPVMNATEAEVQGALDALKRLSLVIDSYGASGRVMRYAHNVPKVLGIGQATTALLAALMLRGAQTAAELRANTERMYQFADISSVEAYLEEMAARPAAALVARLPKQPGSREHRWAHLVGGPLPDELSGSHEAAGGAEAAGESSIAAGEIASVKVNVAQLREEVAQLRALVDRLCLELGVQAR